MSVSDVVARVNALEVLAQRALTPVAPPAQTLASVGPAPSFADILSAAKGSTPIAAPASADTSAPAVVQAAELQIGQSEQPPGSNDGPAVAMYRSAVAGSAPGAPWCAYFVSWAARQAGSPLGDTGQGLGSVQGIADWAMRTGRFVPAGQTPLPGDLILFGDRHVGIVESVAADGTLTTIEGNAPAAVVRTTHAAGEPTGFVRL